jgi:hypothetical protein
VQVHVPGGDHRSITLALAGVWEDSSGELVTSPVDGEHAIIDDIEF